MFLKKLTAMFISISVWVIAINLRKEPNYWFGVWLKTIINAFSQYINVIQFMKFIYWKSYKENKFEVKPQVYKTFYKSPVFTDIASGFYNRKLIGARFLYRSLKKIGNLSNYLQTTREGDFNRNFLFNSFLDGRKYFEL